MLTLLHYPRRGCRTGHGCRVGCWGLLLHRGLLLHWGLQRLLLWRCLLNLQLGLLLDRLLHLLSIRVNVLLLLNRLLLHLLLDGLLLHLLDRLLLLHLLLCVWIGPWLLCVRLHPLLLYRLLFLDLLLWLLLHHLQRLLLHRLLHWLLAAETGLLHWLLLHGLLLDLLLYRRLLLYRLLHLLLHRLALWLAETSWCAALGSLLAETAASWASRLQATANTATGCTSSLHGEGNLLVDVFVRGRFVTGLVTALGRLDLDTDFQRDAVELLAVSNLQNANGVSQGGQLGERDFLGHRVVVLDVEAGEDLTALGEAVDDGEAHCQAQAASGGWLQLRLIHHGVVPACRDRVASTGVRCNGSCVEVQLCHVIQLLQFWRIRKRTLGTP